jgi:hypothetical protein
VKLIILDSRNRNGTMIPKTIQILSLLLVVLMVSYMYVTFYNIHLHCLPNGKFLVHSHPYGDLPGNKKTGHRHTSHEYTIIALINSIIVSILIITIIIILIRGYDFFYSFEWSSDVDSLAIYLTRQLRSPPSCFA